jgi:alpha-tubulin suppressor-like RCC1 family protein
LNEFIFQPIERDSKGNIPSIPVFNYLEAGKTIQIEGGPYVKHIELGDDYSFIIDDCNNAYSCGNNTKGQLGLGHLWPVDSPTLLKELKGKVKSIKTSNEINIAITTTNEMYLWPYQTYKPLKFYLNKKITISEVSCGQGFSILLSHQGIVYSFGRSNKFGELGTGDNLPRHNPEQISFLIEEGEKVDQIICGYKHTIVKGTNGKVYGWGLVYNK